MTTNVLTLCTHNSARSVLSEGMLNHLAKKLGKDVQAYSAGSAPSGRINSYALEALSRRWRLGQGIPQQELGRVHRSWRSHHACSDHRLRQRSGGTVPVLAWQSRQGALGIPGPVKRTRGRKKNAFELTRQAIGYRMLQMLHLPLETMSSMELQSALTAISKS